MKKNKDGFTLIELLAVIVILAIIALIATPIILNLIKKARLGAAQDSAYALRKASELYYSTSLIDNPNFAGIEFICEPVVENGKKVNACIESDGEGNQKSDGKKLALDGTIPSSGTININVNGKIQYSNIKYNNNQISCSVPEKGNIVCADGEAEPVLSMLANEILFDNSATGIDCDKLDCALDKLYEIYS